MDRPTIRPVLVACDERRAVVSLVPEGALLLAGDEVVLHVEVAAGARLEIIEPAGTVAYPMAGASARWDVKITLGAGAGLSWAGEPLVVSEGAAVTRRTVIRAEAGSRVALRESLVLGRHGEGPGSVEQALEASDADGTPILVESLRAGPDAHPLLLAGMRAMGTVLLLGERLADEYGGAHLDLERPGTLIRGVARAAHEATSEAAWAAARGAALSPAAELQPRGGGGIDLRRTRPGADCSLGCRA